MEKTTKKKHKECTLITKRQDEKSFNNKYLFLCFAPLRCKRNNINKFP